MKSFQTRVAIALMAGLIHNALAAEPPVGFDALEHLELLPNFLPNGTQTKQFANYDPAGENRDVPLKRYEQNGEYVFFDEIGPGFLCRQQMNLFRPTRSDFPSEKIHIRYYFDDEPTPRIDMTFDQFFGKGGKYTSPFTPPLAYFDTRGRKPPRSEANMFANMYYPFPFQKRLKVTAYNPDGPLKYYENTWVQYTYLKYPPGTPVETWKGMNVDSPAVRAKFEHVGEDPKQSFDGKTQTQTLSLSPGETKTALDITGQGAITSLHLHLDPWSADTFYHTRIRFTWDDQKTPAVDMSIASFFGGGGNTIGVEDLSKMSLKTLLYGFDAQTGRCYAYWPMPFWSRAHLEIINDSKTLISHFELEANLASPESLTYHSGESGYFCARRTIDISPDNALYSQAFKTEGRGKVVGQSMYSQGYCMDGDEYTNIDGSRSPQIHGSGTEDDHNQGWGGYAIQKPFWGGLINGFQGAYRLYIVEPYIFDSSIDMRFEHTREEDKPTGQKTDFVIWYYLDQPGISNLKLTDTFDVGNADSEQVHAYHLVKEKKMLGAPHWITTSSYDRMEYEPRVATTTDDGHAFTGSSTFTVKIDPANEGIKIRRRVNRSRSHLQRTDVYVDGQLIPDAPWYVCEPEATPETAFHDTDYEIPAAYTKGKDHVTIMLKFVPTGEHFDCANEFFYWIYCYGRTPVMQADSNQKKKEHE